MILQTDSLNYISVFLGGVAVGFSPCVYPLIPMTLGIIGVKAGSSRSKGLLLSLVYVLGLAVMYSILGMIASLTGKLFGQIAAHPLSPFIVGNVCILAGLSFLDAINIDFSGGLRLHNKIKRTGGYFSVFLLGIVSGLIVGPCLTPVLTAILAYVASKQNVLYGASLLFVFAYGMGFMLILTGTFGSFFISLAKSEIWLARIRKISGFILIGIGEYFIIQSGRLLC